MKKRILLLMLIFSILCIGGGDFSQLKAQNEVTIDGTVGNYTTNTTTINVPIKTFNSRSYGQQIYYKGEINKDNGSVITNIAFYVSSSVNEFPYTRNVKVYLTNTEKETYLSTEMVKLSSEDLVYDAGLTFESTGWINIPLNKEFTYTGNNIMVSVWDNTGGYIENTSFSSFTAKDGDENRRCAYKINNSADPVNSTINAGALSKDVPKIKFTFASNSGGGDDPETPTPPTVTLNTPENGATDIFNPSLSFTLGNAKQYQIQMAEGTGAFVIVQDWTDGNGNISYQTNLLKSNTTYSWKVVAKNDDGETTSEVYTFTTKEFAAPGELTNVSPENNAQDLINPKLEWTFGENTEQQQLLIDGEVKVDWTNIGLKTSDSYQTSGLTAGSHTWQVNTRNGEGTTTGTEYSFTVASLPDNVTPISPANGATNVSSNVIRWQFADNTTEYRFLYGEAEDKLAYCGHGTQYEWLEVTTDEVELEAPYFESGKTYYWAVDVQNSVGKRTVYQGGDPISIFSFTTADVAPVTNTAPKDGTNLTEETTTLTWSYGSTNKATHYQVLLGADPTNLDIVVDWTERGIEGTGMVASGSYPTDILEPNTKYYWQVNVKKGEGGAVINGEIWSFVSMLSAPQNVSVNPENAYPTESYNIATTTVTWDAVPNASGYYVYVDGEKYNENELVTDEECEVSGLAYGDHAITVSAYYEGLGESEESEAATVKVAGYGYVNGRVIDSFDGSYLANASVTFTGTDEFETEQTYNIQTSDSYETQGYFSDRILAGTYTMTIEKEGYNSVTRNNVIVEASKTQNLGNIPLSSDYKFGVSLRNPSWNAIDILLTNDEWLNAAEPPYGNYIVYLKKDGSVLEDVYHRYFALNQQTVLLNEFGDIWKELNNGTYQIGVAVIGSEIINWSDEITKDYNIFETAGDITEEANWSDGLPESTDDIFIVAAATIPSGKEVTYNNVTITNNASLTINGKMTAGRVVNEGALSNLCINDGGQLIQSNEELNGKFVMNIVNPNNNNWGDNKDGWQFISSPIKGVSIESFIPNNGDYDLYKYDGDEDLEWRNRKANVESFGSTFEQGVGYLASYQSAVTATFTGTFNSATSHTWNLSYDDEKPLANFHLLGNPFTFNMDVTAATFNNLVNGVAIVNNEGGYTYDVTTIPVGDGFFVQATAPENATDFISLSYGDRAAKSEKSNSLNITATGNAGKDNVVINFAGKSEGFNKLQNFNDDIATVYVQDNDANYGIYNCDENTTEVELCFNANQMGNYTISAQPNGKFQTVTLVDRFTGIETNLLVEDYRFTAMSDVNNNRFILKLAVSDQQSAVSDNFVYQSGEDLIIDAEGTVQIIDMMGRVVYTSNVENNNRINVSDFNNGAYVVRVINENEVKVQKIIL